MKVIVTRTISQSVTIDVPEDVEPNRAAVVALDEATDYSQQYNWVDDGTTYTVELS